jgi:hypothetical protein
MKRRRISYLLAPPVRADLRAFWRAAQRWRCTRLFAPARLRACVAPRWELRRNTRASEARPAPWLHDFQGLLVCHDRHHEIHEAFLAIACCLVLAAELIVIRVL